MKKAIALSFLAALLLAGCGVDIVGSSDEQGAAVGTASAAGTTAEATTAEATTEEAAAEATEEITTSEADPTGSQTSFRETVIAAYKNVLETTDFVNSYALFDMDKDSIPELIFKHGTSEADFQIAVYTFRNGEAKMLADLGGSHTSFAYDYVADQLVLAMGHMGYGFMAWYDIDENGELRHLISTDTLDFSSEDSPTYADYMELYNVKRLDFSVFFQSGDVQKTWIYRYSSGEQEQEEYEGLDYRLLEDHPF